MNKKDAREKKTRDYLREQQRMVQAEGRHDSDGWATWNVEGPDNRETG